MSITHCQQLAILGGQPTVLEQHPDIFRWPIVTEEDENAVLEVIRARCMSGNDITQAFEIEWGQYLGTAYNLAHCNGTAALFSAMFAVGLGRGDELIVPSITFWASAQQAMMLGATPVFAEIDPISLTLDPDLLESKITPRTKAIMVVHYCGHPVDMDRIVTIAHKHNVKVIEDVSHAQGGLYKGRKLGTLGDVAGISMMTGKSFAIGEGGMLSTNDSEIHQRAIAFAHYERIHRDVTIEHLRQVVGPAEFVTGLSLGALKGRINQTCSAMGRVQLRRYDERIDEIQRAMNRFWHLLDGVPGLRPHRVSWLDSTMGGWFNPLGHYRPEELGGLPVSSFIKAVNAEGGCCGRGTGFPLHTHPVFNEADVFHDGQPTRIAFADCDVREPRGSLPVSEALAERSLGIPWFKHDEPAVIEQYAAAYRKVATNVEQLLEVSDVIN